MGQGWGREGPVRLLKVSSSLGQLLQEGARARVRGRGKPLGVVRWDWQVQSSEQLGVAVERGVAVVLRAGPGIPKSRLIARVRESGSELAVGLGRGLGRGLGLGLGLGWGRGWGRGFGLCD